MGVVPDPARDRRRTGIDAEMLLNSRGGRIHLFPAVAPGTAIGFRNFQARGGFLVSACKDAENVYHLEIESRRDIQCQVMNPWPGKRVFVRDDNNGKQIPVRADTSNGECLVFPASAGIRYVLTPKLS